MEIRCPICGYKSYYTFKKTNLLGSFKFYSCKNCDLLFVYPLPTKDMLDFYYSKIFTLPDNQRTKNINKFSQVLKILNINDFSNISVLDIGSGKGDIIKCFYNLGVKEIVGIDIDNDLIKLKNQIKNKKIKIIVGDFLEMERKLEDNYFDIITMFDVIEHFIDPKIYLEKALNKLKKGGKIVITTPNIGSLNYKLYGKYWDWISPPAHLYYFSPKSLKYLLNEFGVRNIQIYSFYGDWEESLISSCVKLPYRILKYHIKCLVLRFLRDKILDTLLHQSQNNNKSTSTKPINYIRLNILKDLDKFLYSRLNYPHLFVVGEKL